MSTSMHEKNQVSELQSLKARRQRRDITMADVLLSLLGKQEYTTIVRLVFGLPRFDIADMSASGVLLLTKDCPQRANFMKLYTSDSLSALAILINNHYWTDIKPDITTGECYFFEVHPGEFLVVREPAATAIFRVLYPPIKH